MKRNIKKARRAANSEETPSSVPECVDDTYRKLNRPIRLIGSSSAVQAREMGLKVGNTIVGRESGPGWWSEAKLRLLFIGDECCVWRTYRRSYMLPEWHDDGESTNWSLDCRDWYLVPEPTEEEAAKDVYHYISKELLENVHSLDLAAIRRRHAGVKTPSE